MAAKPKTDQTSDTGLVIRAKDGSFWTGFLWNHQLRNAKIYHSARYALDIVAGHPSREAVITPVEIRLTGPTN